MIDTFTAKEVMMSIIFVDHPGPNGHLALCFDFERCTFIVSLCSRGAFGRPSKEVIVEHWLQM